MTGEAPAASPSAYPFVLHPSSLKSAECMLCEEVVTGERLV